MLLIVCFIQLLFVTMDPIDSDLIINEQCINLTAIYGLPNVKNILLKSEFLETLKLKIYK